MYRQYRLFKTVRLAHTIILNSQLSILNFSHKMRLFIWNILKITQIYEIFPLQLEKLMVR